jgi:hypothetical protein
MAKIDYATLKKFMGNNQVEVIKELSKGEEGEYFEEVAEKLVSTFKTMPKTYGQDGKGDDAVVYLHYFYGCFDWYITEKDTEDPQYQAFGMANMGYAYAELGYINIEELKANNVELDFHWTPKTIGEIKAKVA